MSPAHLIDVAAARREIDTYLDAVAAGRLSDAIEPRRRLESVHGIVLTWQPGRPKAARTALDRPARAEARVPADPADELWYEFRRAERRRDYRTARRCQRELRKLGISVQPVTCASSRRSTRPIQVKDQAAPDRAAWSRSRGQGSATTPPPGRTTLP
jgi:hypothetical protein